MRSRLVLFAPVLLAGSLALPQFAHAAIPFFGPIIPSGLMQTCPLSWGALITVVNNLIEFGLTIVIVFVAPIIIAYAGFKLVINPFNSGAIKEARSLMLNAVIGIVIALAAWLIVDAIMAALTPGGQPFGIKWQTIINSGGIDPCLNLSTAMSVPVPQAGVMPVAPYTLPTSGNCTPDNIQQAAQAGGYQLASAQASTLACIASAESSCNPNACGNASTVTGQATSACGLFQITFGAGNDQCHNLNLPICTQAATQAGYQVSGNLNCYSAFSGGRPKPGMEQQAAACQAAATNVSCNTAAAVCLMQASGGNYSAWTADPRSTKQQQCISQFANI